MGMFDYLRCEVPLPDGYEADGLFQTKDFDCEMVVHVITKEGRLMLERIDATHLVPEAERPYPNEKGLLGMCGMLRSDKSVHQSNFHGIVNFYDSEYRTLDDKPARPNGVLHHGGTITDATTGEPLKRVAHDYSAKFTDGQLVGIELIDDD